MKEEFFSEREKRTLELEARRRIFHIVRQNPGSHFREIERISKLATGSVQYHLDYLARQGLIKVEKDANNTRYFPKEFSSVDKKLMGLLRQRSVRNILLFIFNHEHCNHEQIVDFVRLSPSTVSWHLKKLQLNGVISSTQKGRKTHYSLTIDKNEIAKLLISYQESFLDSIVDNIVEMWDD